MTAICQPRRTLAYLRLYAYPFGALTKDRESFETALRVYGRAKRVSLQELFPGIESEKLVLMRAFDRVAGVALDVTELSALCAIAKFTCARRIVEVGTYQGGTALNLAANSPDDAIVTTIDLPPGWNGRPSIPIPRARTNATAPEETGRQYKGTPYESKIRQIYCDSATIVWTTLAPADLVFIDACHHYEYVKRDTAGALSILSPGGTIVWHDYSAIYDVSRVVDELSTHIEVSVLSGTRLAIGRCRAQA